MTTPDRRNTLIDAYFGDYGGQYVPDDLLPALDELEFPRERTDLHRVYLGRPAPITRCANLPLAGAGKGKARIFFKSEDLVHGGVHKVNQVVGQDPITNMDVHSVVNTLTQEGLAQ